MSQLIDALRTPAAEPGTGQVAIGMAVSRVDGRDKVTGAARYAAEFPADGLLFGVVVSATITKGRIAAIDDAAALAVPGVHAVLTHMNRPAISALNLFYKDMTAPGGAPFKPLRDDRILSHGQPVALVVADTFEAARHAASLVEVRYDSAAHDTNLRANLARSHEPKKKRPGYSPPPAPKGNADQAWDDAPRKIQGDYYAGVEHHNPMELFASTVIPGPDGHLTIYDKTQSAQNSRWYVSHVFGLPKDKVTVRNPYVGGAFGAGLRPQYQLPLAVMAALHLQRPVRVVLSRQQMFTFGHRPETLQRVRLGADADGTLRAIIHEAVAETSQNEEFVETVVNWSGQLYACDNIRLGYHIVELDRFTPIDMRAPGAAHGVHALEVAMDELAYELQMDPLALRLKNYAETDPSSGLPYSSKALRDCYAQAAERFGWAMRSPAPRSMRVGNELVGWGMATGMWDALQMFARAHAVLHADGSLVVSSAASDIGTGTYTAMAMIASAALGLPLEQVRFQLGDSTLPVAPVEGGSSHVATVGSAVQGVCDKLKWCLFRMAKAMPDSPLAKAHFKQVEFSAGTIRLLANPAQAISLTALLQGNAMTSIEDKYMLIPAALKKRKFQRATHSAVFCEVRVDEQFGTVRVTRVVSAVAAGRIINAKAARSQIVGGVVWGISQALHEESHDDLRLGRFMNHNLSEYHVPVNADIHDIDVIFVDEDDRIVSSIGAKGVGEIGQVGVAAAVSNAIFHATGRRVRSTPMTPDKVMLPGDRR
ncbi:xanthine dehydrogenase family protein molybdopterin-binding subunit [Massilia sp. CF038]|uniref:xanthine dehydrogenase family protein molybdopterin-binding subunit n=1 Tax=Massilia sp. CF038 TaxID=1881045 RepID=UPI00091856A3|nr:xanthine dehydrogenase family protein molybdopterin-binding subunit [Massilia sp. CF038]SHH19503.1 xanthine dehydrogenase, molybdenum binding subunit apoprotein [Massilia sp. CF038]